MPTLETKLVQTNSQRLRGLNWQRLSGFLLAIYACAQILLIVFVCVNHIAFPLNLEAMELTVLQHVERVLSGLPLYPEPSADFIALAYNPLYYYLCIPFTWIFGANLFTLRLVSILGMLGSGVIIFLATRKATASNWWGLMSVGLFAAAYRAMDAYLDTAHRDSWLLLSILLGCYWIDQNHSQARNTLAVLCLVLAFWFKQPGALFAIGGSIYLIVRHGWRHACPALLLAMLLGPGLYLVVPDRLWGTHFHYFTWEVPRHWREFSLFELHNFVQVIARFYLIPALLACVAFARVLIQQWLRNMSIWYFMLPIALLSGLAAAYTPGSNNNVFIPMEVWLILIGTIGLKQLADTFPWLYRWKINLLALTVSFALLVYNPRAVLVSADAASVYQDFVSYLKSIPGSVYAPWIGQLQDGYKFYPAAHWVPLEDMVRGPNADENNHPTVFRILQPVIHPEKSAYILHTSPLEEDSMLKFLSKYYVLETNLSERFKDLSTLPRRYSAGYPTLLYRYQPQ